MSQAVLHRIASGDKTAVQDCLSKYGGLVWSLARRMSPNTDDAEDAVQEIFTDIWKHADRFDETQASETTFVAMIARRRLIDRLRKSNRQPNADSLEDILIEPAKDYTRELQISIEAKEVAVVMRDLRPEQQKVLYLSIVQGLSHQEIADLTGMPVGTVKTHARRGLIQIRELLNNSNSGQEVSA
ncbi:MAG: RNA polymerase sigma factor [Pyrinomonadaceae bacterium]